MDAKEKEILEGVVWVEKEKEKEKEILEAVVWVDEGKEKEEEIEVYAVNSGLIMLVLHFFEIRQNNYREDNSLYICMKTHSLIYLFQYQFLLFLSIQVG